MTKNPENRGKLLFIFFMGAIIGALTKQGVMTVGFSYLFYGITLGFIAEPFRKVIFYIFLRKNNRNSTILDEDLVEGKVRKIPKVSFFSLPKWSNIYNNGSVIMGFWFIISLIFTLLFWEGIHQD